MLSTPIHADPFREAAQSLLDELKSSEVARAAEGPRLNEIRSRYTADDALTQQGEVRSITYFEDNAIGFKRNHPVGCNKIEFLIEVNGKEMLWEVADFGQSDLAHSMLKGHFDSFLRFKDALEPEYFEQLKRRQQRLSR